MRCTTKTLFDSDLILLFLWFLYLCLSFSLEKCEAGATRKKAIFASNVWHLACCIIPGCCCSIQLLRPKERNKTTNKQNIVLRSGWKKNVDSIAQKNGWSEGANARNATKMFSVMIRSSTVYHLTYIIIGDDIWKVFCTSFSPLLLHLRVERK